MLASRAKRFGVRLLPVIEAPGPPGTSAPPTDRCRARLFARFLGKAAARYGHRGSFLEGPAGPVRDPFVADHERGQWHHLLGWTTRKRAATRRSSSPRRRRSGRTIRGPRSCSRGCSSRRGAGGDRQLGLPPAALQREDEELLRHRRDPSLLDDPGGDRERHPEDEEAVIRKRKDRNVTLRISEFGWGSGQCSTYCAGTRGPGADADGCHPPVRAQAQAVEDRGRQLVLLAGRAVPRPAVTARPPACSRSTVDPKPSWEAFLEAAESVKR